jgi:hypothetical protein
VPPLNFSGLIIEYCSAMEDFLVRKMGAEDSYMYIGFTDQPGEDSPMINCRGLAKVRTNNRYECWFNYSFHHSIDWSKLSGIVLKPVRKYKITDEELKRIGIEIMFNIREFISRMN